MRIDEDGDEVQESALLDKPRACQSPQLVKDAAKARGITCQSLFERAYRARGGEDSYARAVFCVFAGQSQEVQEELIPLPVREYAERAFLMPSLDIDGQRGKCMGCMLTEVGFKSYAHGYSVVWPEVNTACLMVHARGPVSAIDKMSIPPRVDNPQVVREERAWQALQESGALDQGHEDLTALMRSDEEL